MSTQIFAASNQLLESLGEELDITPAQYKEAKDHYDAVGTWLNQPDTLIAKYRPIIYPQGSFRLGTVVRPIGDGNEYDVDLVCELQGLTTGEITPPKLKELVGARLRENKHYAGMLEPKNRCWTLNYADGARFHMDILPAIPDLSGLPTPAPSRSFGPIAIPDRALNDWTYSNPTGYAEWFKDRMKVLFVEAREKLAKSLREHVENIPDYRVPKTPLQRAVQILKRHRDLYFQEKEGRPSSILITTLSARAYNNQASVVEALQTIVRDMPQYVEVQGRTYIVLNPVNPKENFIDCWESEPQLRDSFLAWLGQARTDFAKAVQQENVSEVVKSLESPLGERIVKLAAAKTFSEDVLHARQVAAPHIAISSQPSKPYAA